MWLVVLCVQGLALRPLFGLIRIPLGILSYLIAPAYDLAHYPRLRAENASLRHTVAMLTQQSLNTAALQAENVRLRGLLELRETQPATHLIIARVIARDPTQWTRAVLINKGQHDGLALGTPVIAATGVVGKIVEVYPSTSLALLVTDADVRFGVTVARSRDQGLAAGDGGWHIYVLYLATTSDAAPGDEVVTSGLGGVFPKGLRVGRITAVAADPSRLYRIATVEPSAPLGQLEDVGCLVSP